MEYLHCFWFTLCLYIKTTFCLCTCRAGCERSANTAGNTVSLVSSSSFLQIVFASRYNILSNFGTIWDAPCSVDWIRLVHFRLFLLLRSQLGSTSTQGRAGRRVEAGNGSGPLLLVPVWQTHHRGETTNFGRARRQIPTQTSSTDLLNSEDSWSSVRQSIHMMIPTSTGDSRESCERTKEDWNVKRQVIEIRPNDQMTRAAERDNQHWWEMKARAEFERWRRPCQF